MHKCSEKMQSSFCLNYANEEEMGLMPICWHHEHILGTHGSISLFTALLETGTCPVVPRLPASVLLSEENPPQLCLPPSQ